MLGKLRAHVQVCIYTHAHLQARTHARTEMCTHTCVRASTCTHARDMRCPLCSNAHQHHVSDGLSQAPAVPKAVPMPGLTPDRFYPPVISDDTLSGYTGQCPKNKHQFYPTVISAECAMCFAVISVKIREPVMSGVDKFAPVGVDAQGALGTAGLAKVGRKSW
jgi:hypothetical protein